MAIDERRAVEAQEIDDDQRWDLVERSALNALTEFFDRARGGDVDKTAVGVARVATSTISASTRRMQTKSAQQATMVTLATQLAANKEELRRYIKISMPDSPLVKALPAGEG